MSTTQISNRKGLVKLIVLYAYMTEHQNIKNHVLKKYLVAL